MVLGYNYSHIEDIQCLYYNIVNCLHIAASDSIPSSKSNRLRDKNITPGWNDFVKVGPVIFRDRGKVAEFAELPT